jgi:hypothetical protein
LFSRWERAGSASLTTSLFAAPTGSYFISNSQTWTDKFLDIMYFNIVGVGFNILLIF